MYQLLVVAAEKQNAVFCQHRSQFCDEAEGGSLRRLMGRKVAIWEVHVRIDGSCRDRVESHRKEWGGPTYEETDQWPSRLIYRKAPRVTQNYGLHPYLKQNNQIFYITRYLLILYFKVSLHSPYRQRKGIRGFDVFLNFIGEIIGEAHG